MSDRAITAVVIAQDEAGRLPDCVGSVRPFADEVLVVDGGSRDATVAVARDLGCTVVENPWPGYGAQRNVGARAARHDWLFWIDADEVAGSELAGAIARWRAAPDGGPSAYGVHRVGDFLGRWLPGAGDWHVRLYDRRAHAVAERDVHEAVELGGATAGRLEGVLWHHGFRSIDDHVARFNRYTALEAGQAFAAGRRFSVARLLWRPPARIVQKLAVERMVRQGVAGVAVALLWAYYEVLRELKLYERQWRAQGAPGEARRG